MFLQHSSHTDQWAECVTACLSVNPPAAAADSKLTSSTSSAALSSNARRSSSNALSSNSTGKVSIKADIDGRDSRKTTIQLHFRKDPYTGWHRSDAKLVMPPILLLLACLLTTSQGINKNTGGQAADPKDTYQRRGGYQKALQV